MKANLNYSQYAIAAFSLFQYIPDPRLETRLDVKQVRASYLACAHAIVILCKPPFQELLLSPICRLSPKEFLAKFPRESYLLLDSLTYLADSSTYAVGAIDPAAPNFALDSEEWRDLVGSWDTEAACSSRTLKGSFSKLNKKLTELCPKNPRLRLALIRLGNSFEIADGLHESFTNH